MVVSKENQFKDLSHEIKTCTKCEGLNISGMTESSPGFGDLNSPIMIIGQSLCRKCMETQIPFTGGSGRLLDAAFKKARIKKEQIFITNTIHCHPPNNRKTFPHEIENCNGFLKKEIELVNPKIIIPLGRDAVVSILDINSWPKKVGKKITNIKYTVYPMYHPSYITKLGKIEIENYVKKISDILKHGMELRYKIIIKNEKTS